MHSLISSGSWVLPVISPRILHVHHNLLNWFSTFDFLYFNLHTNVCIHWNLVPHRKIKIWHVWDSIRTRLPKVPWSSFVWHRLKITRYACHERIHCHGRLPSVHHLASFGMNVSHQCSLCVGGTEDAHHLFIICNYSRFILTALARHLMVGITDRNWMDLLRSWGHIPDGALRNLCLLAAQVYSYQI